MCRLRRGIFVSATNRYVSSAAKRLNSLSTSLPLSAPAHLKLGFPPDGLGKGGKALELPPRVACESGISDEPPLLRQLAQAPLGRAKRIIKKELFVTLRRRSVAAVFAYEINALVGLTLLQYTLPSLQTTYSLSENSPPLSSIRSLTRSCTTRSHGLRIFETSSTVEFCQSSTP